MTTKYKERNDVIYVTRWLDPKEPMLYDGFMMPTGRWLEKEVKRLVDSGIAARIEINENDGQCCVVREK